MSIKSIEPPSGLEMPETPSADAVVLPRETDGEIGLYDDSVVTLVKELREAGATALSLISGGYLRFRDMTSSSQGIWSPSKPGWFSHRDSLGCFGPRETAVAQNRHPAGPGR